VPTRPEISATLPQRRQAPTVRDAGGELLSRQVATTLVEHGDHCSHLPPAARADHAGRIAGHFAPPIRPDGSSAARIATEVPGSETKRHIARETYPLIVAEHVQLTNMETSVDRTDPCAIPACDVRQPRDARRPNTSLTQSSMDWCDVSITRSGCAGVS
jgi:hypothetical protein